MRRSLVSILISTQVILAAPSHQIRGRLIKLSRGVTQIYLTDPRRICTAVLSHRENFNAHGFDIFSLSIKDTADKPELSEWHSITFFDENSERLVLTVEGGADCLLHDFRLFSTSDGKSLQLVLADRELNGSFVDEDIVTFSFYELKKNVNGNIGKPLYYFDRVRTQVAKKKYCDVGEAFKNELGFSNYMVRLQ